MPVTLNIETFQIAFGYFRGPLQVPAWDLGSCMVDAYMIALNTVALSGAAVPMLNGGYVCAKLNIQFDVWAGSTPVATYLEFAAMLQAMDAFQHTWYMPSMDISLWEGRRLIASGRLSYMGY